jgi:hypothetical protein
MYFLGGINNLPPLPPELLAQNVDHLLPPGETAGEIARKLELAFGSGCEELNRPMTLIMRDKGVVLATGQLQPQDDGRVLLSPFSAALFPKHKVEGFPEITTVQSEAAYLTLDRPVKTLSELSSRKVTKVELVGRDIILINNRKTPKKGDDLEVRLSSNPELHPRKTEPEMVGKARLVYDEMRNLIWSDDHVKLLDTKDQPNPTEIKARGMEMTLAKDPSADKAKAGAGAAPKPKGENTGPVDLLVLRSDVVMHLWVDQDSGFLGNPSSTEKKPAPDIVAKPPAEKSQVVIKTNGPFTYDLTKELAWFDSPPVNATAQPLAPTDVHVLRVHKAANAKDQHLDPLLKDVRLDQLVCDHLELKFRRKQAPARGAGQGDGGGKEIETALATSRKEVVLTMDTENLEAWGSELFYQAGSPDGSKGPQTILKGSPMRAAKDGHKIVAVNLLLIGANKAGLGQQARAKGPGQIDLFDRGNLQNQYPLHAVWNDVLTSVKDREGDQVYDLLTLTGDARFIDDERNQRLHGERLQVWMKPNSASADVPASTDTGQGSMASKQKLHRVLAQERVKAFTPEMLIRHTKRLTIMFLPEVAEGDRLPEVAAAPVSSVTTVQKPAEMAPPPAAPPAPAVAGPAPVAPVNPKPALIVHAPPEEKKERKKEDKPIELTADEVVMYVTTLGTKKELHEMKAEGNVYVVQEGKQPGEKSVEIDGQLLTLLHHRLGDRLDVYGEHGKWGRLDLGELKMQGPKITINQRTNVAEIEGQGVMTLPPSDKNFDGTPAKTGPDQPRTSMMIHWNKRMNFNGRYAEFEGGVQAYQDNSKLLCQSMTAMMDRFVSLKEGQKGGQSAKVEQVVCQDKVYAVDVQREHGDGKLLQASIIEGRWLETETQEGPTKVHGPGRVRHLAPAAEDDKKPARPAAPRPQKSAEVLKLTRIEFVGMMYSNNKSVIKNAKFFQDVHVYHFPADSLDAVMNPDNPPKDGFYLRCELLSVAARQVGNKRSQIMVAEDRVFFRTEEFYGYADVVKYNEESEMIIFEATKSPHVIIYKQTVKGGKAQPVTGKKILYNRRTGEIDGGNSNLFQSSQLAPRPGTAPSLPQARLHANGKDDALAQLGIAGVDAAARDQGQKFAADRAVDDLALRRRGDGQDDAIVLVGGLLDHDRRFLTLDEREGGLLFRVERSAGHGLETKALELGIELLHFRGDRLEFGVDLVALLAGQDDDQGHLDFVGVAGVCGWQRQPREAQHGDCEGTVHQGNPTRCRETLSTIDSDIV